MTGCSLDPVTKQPKGEPVYSTEMLCPKNTFSKFWTWNEEKGERTYDSLENFCLRLAKDRFGSDYDIDGAKKHGGISWPIKDGDEKASQDPFANLAFTLFR